MKNFPSPPLSLTKETLMNPLRRLACLTTVVVLSLLMLRTVSAGLIMRIDTDSKTFFIDGSDTGNAQFDPDLDGPSGGTYSLQFIHYFSTTVPEFGTITTSAQNLFVQGATLPMYGHMYMVSNSGQNYVFMDLFSYTGGDITTLTGTGPSAATSYAGLPAADIPLFESLIGDTLGRTIGTGYSSISVQAVPEPFTCIMALAGIACGGFSMWRRRKQA
jgi:hypothetical protein